VKTKQDLCPYPKNELPSKVLLARFYVCICAERRHYEGDFFRALNMSIITTKSHCKRAIAAGYVTPVKYDRTYLTEKGKEKVKLLHIKQRMLGQEGKYPFNDDWNR
jgi:Mn-dependent DtxR family transcriptional regulator